MAFAKAMVNMPLETIVKTTKKVDKYAHLKKDDNKHDIPETKELNMNEGVDVDKYLQKLYNIKGYKHTVVNNVSE